MKSTATILLISGFLGLYAIQSVFFLSLNIFINTDNTILNESSSRKSQKSSKPQTTSLQATFFAQTHLKQPSENYFFLTSDREVFVKAYVISSTGSVPTVSLEITSPMFHSSVTNTISMTAPSSIPTSNVNISYGQIDHTLDNAFTGKIPKDWIKVDTEIDVLIDGVIAQTFTSTDLNVRSSNPIRFNLYEIHAFALGGNSTDTAQLREELTYKFPFSSLDFNYVPDILFPEIAVPPVSGNNAVVVSSISDYATQTGSSFNTHNGLATEWRQALRVAQGVWYRYHAFNSVGWYYDGGQQTKGSGADYGAVHAKGAKLFWHEVGHGLGAPHWGNSYPYMGDMHGISKPDASNWHVGPVWGYYAPNNYPIPPTVQANAVGSSNSVGNYKQDPMRGGGSGDQESGFLYRHFSDYSVDLMAYRLQNGGGGIAASYVVWNPNLTNADNPNGMYAQWDAATGDYTSPVQSDHRNNEAGIEYPLNGDVNQDIYSVMFAVSATYPNANLVYPPIGPYKGGLINVFDPTQGTSADAQFFCDFKQGFYNYTGCHYTAKITQGGQVKHYMVRAQSTGDGFDHVAINIPASGGTITQIELLDTPSIDDTGAMPTNPTIIASWTSPNIPVTLVNFDAKLVEDEVLLQWNTASELNNEGFEIERSKNVNPNGHQEWETIGFVEGQGTTTIEQSYTFVDQQPFDGINYYRLKQVDFDGAFEYSTIVPVQYQTTESDKKLAIFPNPTTETLTYTVPNLQNVQSVQLFDPFGKLVKIAEQIDGQLSLQGLSTGMYLLVIKTNEEEWKVRVFKQ